MQKLLRKSSRVAVALMSMAAVASIAPNAGAQEVLPEQISSLLPKETVDQVNAAVSSAQEQVAQAVQQVQQAVQPAQQEYADQGFQPIVDGPNYHWTNDLSSQVMAATPGPVLHRVQGSWFNAPDVPAESIEAEKQGKSLYGPGTPIYVGDNDLCTVAFTGTDAAGRKLAVTAGHCGGVGSQVTSADSWRVGPSGTVAATNPNLDYSVIELGSNAKITNTYNGVTVNQLGQGSLAPGQVACKSGVATGNTCGMTWSSQPNTQFTQICASQGDSGAPVLLGDRVVGMVNGGMLPIASASCRTPLQGPLFMPTVSVPVDSILADLNSRDAVGTGFTPAS